MKLKFPILIKKTGEHVDHVEVVAIQEEHQKAGEQ